jgi:hypothetical protein
MSLAPGFCAARGEEECGSVCNSSRRWLLAVRQVQPHYIGRGEAVDCAVHVNYFVELKGRRSTFRLAEASLPEWGADGRELFYLSADSMPISVSLQPGPDSLELEPSAPRALFPWPEIDTDVSPYEVARDGQRFLVLETAKYAQPLT